MEITTKIFKLVFFSFSVGFSLSFGEKDSSENENLTNLSGSMSENKQKADSEPKTMGINLNVLSRQKKPNIFVTPERQLIVEPRLHFAQLADGGLGVPYLGFSPPENQRSNIYLTDNTGKYNVKLQNFQNESPSNFQTALGAISAHLLNQRNNRNNQEYIPYPPNGDPYNYPGYRGHPRATEPPVVRAYERASSSNYDNQSRDFNQQNSRSLFLTNDHQLDYSDRFQNFGLNFYSNPQLINEGTLYPQLKRNSAPISKWYNEGEEYQHPVK